MLNFERRWLMIVFESVVPSDANDRVPWGARDVPLGRFVDDLLASAPLKFILGLRLCLWLLVLCPIAMLRRPTTFLGLSPEERLAVLMRLRDSPVYVVREMPLLFKTVACLGFCGLSPIQSRLGIYPVDSTLPSWARPPDPSDER